jgi:hypothetical protein
MMRYATTPTYKNFEQVQCDAYTLSRIKGAERRFPDVYAVGETFFVWSNRAAKQVVSYSQ